MNARSKQVLFVQVSDDDDVVNAALKQVARLEQLVKHLPADCSASSLTTLMSSVSSGTM